MTSSQYFAAWELVSRAFAVASIGWLAKFLLALAVFFAWVDPPVADQCTAGVWLLVAVVLGVLIWRAYPLSVIRLVAVSTVTLAVAAFGYATYVMPVASGPVTPPILLGWQALCSFGGWFVTLLTFIVARHVVYTASLQRVAADNAADSSSLGSDESLGVSFLSSMDMMCVADVSGFFVRVNSAFERALGYTEAELVASPFVEFVHPDDRQATIAEIKNLSIGKNTVSFENRYRHKSGRWIWLSWTCPAPRRNQSQMIATARIANRQKASEQAVYRLQFMIDTAAEGIFTIAGDGRIVHTNRTACERLDYRPDELTALDITTIEPACTAEVWAQRWQRLKDRGHLTFESEQRAKSGRIFPVEVSLGYFQFRDSEYGCLFVRDLSARKRSEAALAQSQSLLRSALENTRASVWRLDVNRDELVFPVAPTWLGYDDQSGPPTSAFWRTFIHPEDEAVLEQARSHCLEGTEDYFECEYRVRDQSGEYRWTLHRGNVVSRDLQGRALEMVGSDIDITVLKETQAALERAHHELEARVESRTRELSETVAKLRESEQRMRTVIESAPDAIIAVDADGVIRDWNPAAQAAFGFDRQTAVDAQLYELLIPTRMRERYQAAFAAYVGQPDLLPMRYHAVAVHRDGHDVPVEISVFPLQTGTAFMICAFVRDLTELRRAEELGRQLEAELAHVTRLATLGEMVSGIAHELNQPLAAIVNYAEVCAALVERPTESSQEELSDAIRRIGAQGIRAAQIIRRLRSLAQRGKPVRSDEQVATLVNDVLGLVEAELQQNSIQIDTHLEPVPRVNVDRIQIQQVVLNLVRNAIDVLADCNSKQRVITIESQPADRGFVEVTVGDNGPGIEPPTAEKIFDAFYTTKPDGMGMGLAISRTIVEFHDGRMWVATNPTGGVTFHFTVPSAIDHDSERDRRAAIDPVQASITAELTKAHEDECDA